ncbi:MAG: sugar-binding transcriptional regulator [Limnochorda sp.]|uniref:sugar-binding transcriptional regulator n=1 Tax=Limnochorda sp. TaxID=1940279 RepID=UPI0039C00A9E
METTPKGPATSKGPATPKEPATPKGPSTTREGRSIPLNARMARLYEAARLYYVEHLTQAEVAARLGLSRSRVSRLLQEAWEAGLISVSLTYPEAPSTRDAARALKARFGLADARVTSVDDPADAAALRRRIGQAAAAALPELLERGQVVGISWGRTLYEMVQAVEPTAGDGPASLGVTVVPLLGAVGEADPRYQASFLAYHLARALGGMALPFHAPAYADSPDGAATFLRQAAISRAAQLWGALDVALVGVGPSVYHSPVIQAGELAGPTLLELIRQKAAGELCTHFFDEQGELCQHSAHDRFVGIPWAQLRRVPRVIGVAGGPEKIPALRIALERGYLTGLITDLKTAEALLAE